MGRYAQARRRGGAAAPPASVLPIPELVQVGEAGLEYSVVGVVPAQVRIEWDDGVEWTLQGLQAWDSSFEATQQGLWRVIGLDGDDIPVTQYSNIVNIIL